jgi:hypothetical protein
MVTVALLAPTACSNGAANKGTAGANPTLATDPPTTTTTNPYAVPAVIDVAYVNRVLAGLDAAVGDIVRLVIQTKTIPPEALERMKAVYVDPDRIQRSIDGFQRDLRLNLAGYRQNPGNKTTIVSELITASPVCIFAKVQRDYSAVSTDQSALRNPQWVGLKPFDRSRDSSRSNPTPWAFIYDGFPADPTSQPANPCVS